MASVTALDRRKLHGNGLRDITTSWGVSRSGQKIHCGFRAEINCTTNLVFPVKCFCSMGTRSILLAATLFGTLLPLGQAQDAPLPPPRFHHLHLNSPDPEAEIAFYTKNFTTTQRAMFHGQPALKAGNAGCCSIKWPRALR